MAGMWTALVPLIVGSALVPVQIVITTLLLRAPAGKFAAVAWVAGMTTVRLVQGLVFGLIIGPSADTGSSDDGPGTGISLLLLVVSVLFYVAALKQLLQHPDEDAPPPRWMAMFDGVSPRRAYALGVGLVLISAKFWVFTLTAIAVIAATDLGQGASILAFVVFVALAEGILLGLLAVAYAAPDRSAAVLDRVAAFLQANNRILVIVLGVVFGTWFLVKALDGLGIL